MKAYHATEDLIVWGQTAWPCPRNNRQLEDPINVISIAVFASRHGRREEERWLSRVSTRGCFETS